MRHGPGLLDLPAELRNKIYELVLDDSTVCPFVWQCSPGKRKYGYSLTQTCRQIRQETLHMWHASSKLLFAMRTDNMKHYKNWLRRRPDSIFQSIRRIQLEDYQHGNETSHALHPSYCRSAIVINLAKAAPVTWKRDLKCLYCPQYDRAVDRVKAVVQNLDRTDGYWVLTREKLDEIFEAAARQQREL